MAWTPPIALTVGLPAHAVTSSGIGISVRLGVLPGFTITITDNTDDFVYRYQINDEPAREGASGEGNTSIVINDAFSGDYVGSVQQIHVSVRDSDGNIVVETIEIIVEG